MHVNEIIESINKIETDLYVEAFFSTSVTPSLIVLISNVPKGSSQKEATSSKNNCRFMMIGFSDDGNISDTSRPKMKRTYGYIEWSDKPDYVKNHIENLKDLIKSLAKKWGQNV